MSLFVSIVIDLKNKNIDKLYDYIVPINFQNKIKKGMRVLVPFGEQIRMGIVFDILENSELATKEIVEIYDEEVVLSDASWLMFDILKKNNISIIQKLIETIIPEELWIEYQKEVTLIKEYNSLDNDYLSELFKNRKKRILNWKKLSSYQKRMINSYVNKEILIIENIFKPISKSKYQSVIKYNNKISKLTPKQQEIVDYVEKIGEIDLKELINFGFSKSIINTLVKNNVLIKKEIIVNRNPNLLYNVDYQRHTLTKDQNKAVNEIKTLKNDFYLLHGVTNSGKTEVYLNLIDEAIKLNKQVIYLVPNISLIAHIGYQLKYHYPNNVSIYHSELSQGERFDAINNYKMGNTKILLATRSGIFLNNQNTKYLIIDEAHDSSYIQDEGIYYDVLELAKTLKIYQTKVILGTATPLINQMYLALNKKYHLIKLDHKINFDNETETVIVDMKDELKKGNVEILSKKLKSEMIKAFNNNEQVIVLYNQKGYAPFVMCRSCGFVPKCANCDLSLTYFQNENMLKCKYCGYQIKYETTCSKCLKNYIKPVGLGIEAIEYELKKIFPDQKIIRMDRNTVNKKDEYEKTWYDFSTEKANILLGTEMISKGFDFKNVTVVAILMADMSFKVPTYLANENAYVLFNQLIGRVGRHKKGIAIVQAYDTNNYVIKSLDKNYNYFYEKALNDRKLKKYEPFYYNSQLVFSGESYYQTYQEAFKVKMNIENKYHQVIGPSEALIKKVRNEYRFIVTIKNEEKIDLSNINFNNKNVKVKFYPNISLV